MGNAKWCRNGLRQSHYNGGDSARSQDTKAEKNQECQGILSKTVNTKNSERMESYAEGIWKPARGQCESSTTELFFPFSRMESCSLQLGPQAVLWNFFLSVFRLVISA